MRTYNVTVHLYKRRGIGTEPVQIPAARKQNTQSQALFACNWRDSTKAKHNSRPLRFAIWACPRPPCFSTTQRFTLDSMTAMHNSRHGFSEPLEATIIQTL